MPSLISQYFQGKVRMGRLLRDRGDTPSSPRNVAPVHASSPHASARTLRPRASARRARQTRRWDDGGAGVGMRREPTPSGQRPPNACRRSTQTTLFYRSISIAFVCLRVAHAVQHSSGCEVRAEADRDREKET